MANPGYMTIKGVAQGLISAGCSTPESILLMMSPLAIKPLSKGYRPFCKSSATF